MVSVVLQGRNKFEVPRTIMANLVHFSEPDVSEANEGRLYVSAPDIIDGTVDPKKIKGKLLIVGTSAAGLKDVETLPSGRLPGVEVRKYS